MQRSHEEKVFGEIRLARPAKTEAEAPLPEPRRVNCPLCRNVIVVPDEQKAADLDCIVCGMKFRFTPPQDSAAQAPHGPLENWLAGKPVKLRRLSKWQELRRWCGERPYLVGTTAGMLLVLTLVSWLSISAYRNAYLHLRQASQQLEQWHRQQAETRPAPAENQPPQKLAAPVVEPSASVASEEKPAAKAAASPAGASPADAPAVNAPAAAAPQKKPTASAVAKASDTPAIVAPQNKATSKPPARPASITTAVAAGKPAAKAAAKPAKSATTADANPAQEVALPALGSAQRDATLR